MLGERTTAWALALLLSGAAAGAQAQDAQTDGQAAEPTPEGQPGATEQAASAEVTQPAPAAQPAQPAPPARPTTLDPPPPPPIMVVVLAERRVPAEAATALGAALAEALGEPAGRREVHALGNPVILERLGACEDDACYGAVLAEAQAAAGVFVRVSRRGRRYALVVEARDPVSGTLRAEAVEVQIEREAEPAEALAPHLEQIVPLIPGPPPPDPTLLVTVNVDGAAVAIDGISIGESPVAPVTVASGFHEVSVTLGGYAAVTRRTQVAPGDTGRVDVTLRALSPEAVAAATQGQGGSTGQQSEVFEEQITDQWWFWTLIGGGAVLVIGAIIVIAIVAGSGDSTNQMLPTGLPLPRIEGGMF